MNSRAKQLALLIIPLIVLVQLALPVAAFADDTTPPPVATEEPVATEAPVADEPAIAEETVVEDQLTVAEVFEQLPEETQVVVINEAGDLEPLASEEAAAIIAKGDPMWCPALVDPGGAGCTAAFATVTLLIADLAANPKSGAGTIYFTPTYAVDDVSFDHSVAALNTLTDLTIQGGWNGLIGVDYALSGVSVFSVPISVTNWEGSVTIKNITVSSGAGDGIHVQTKGDINLENVTSSNNTAGSGAYLDNTSGTGKITLTGANTFNDNQGHGLWAFSKGDITLNDITANRNNNWGANLVNTFGTGKITLTGTNTFNDNYISGLRADSNGDITLNNMTANGNKTNSGAYLDNMIGTGNITITCGEFNDNAQHGVEATLSSVLTLNGVTFSNNTAGDLNQTGGTLVTNAFDCNPPIEKDPRKPISSFPVNVIPTSGGQFEELDCASFRGSRLILPNGDSVFIPCPNGDQAKLDPLGNDNLPGALGDPFAFISGMSVTVQPKVNGDIKIEFFVPEDSKGKTLSILFWTGTEWKELGGALDADGKFTVNAGEGGSFVLVSK